MIIFEVEDVIQQEFFLEKRKFEKKLRNMERDIGDWINRVAPPDGHE